jgi:hypothetical protein
MGRMMMGGWMRWREGVGSLGVELVVDVALARVEALLLLVILRVRAAYNSQHQLSSSRSR